MADRDIIDADGLNRGDKLNLEDVGYSPETRVTGAAVDPDVIRNVQAATHSVPEQQIGLRLVVLAGSPCQAVHVRKVTMDCGRPFHSLSVGGVAMTLDQASPRQTENVQVWLEQRGKRRFVSRICGRLPARAVFQVYDTTQFP